MLLLDPLHSSENKQQEWLIPVDLVSSQSLCLGLPWVLQKEPSSLLQQSWWPEHSGKADVQEGRPIGKGQQRSKTLEMLQTRAPGTREQDPASWLAGHTHW